MQNAIRNIIDSVPQGCIFDSHFVINQLIRNFSDDYLIFASGINAQTNKTEMVHMQIGKEIAKYNGTLIRQTDFSPWSENIHGNPGKCTCWSKL